MNLTVGAKVISSLKEYISYRLLKDIRAFNSRTVNLTQYSDPRRASYTVYGAPYSPWVYNSSISGVNVASGVSGASFIPRTQSGLSIDYQNGRVLFSGGVTGLSLTANVSIPEINVYEITIPEAQLIAKTNFGLLPTLKSATGYLPPYSPVVSALFLRLIKRENEMACLGGGEWSDYNIRITAILQNSLHLTIVDDLLADLKNRTVPLLSTGVLNELGDLKNANWDYNSELNNPSDYFYLEDSYVDFVENDQFTARNPDLYIGVGTIKAKLFRFPRTEFP